MADFPEVSGAISKVISSVVPPRAYIFLVALLPGLSFEIALNHSNFSDPGANINWPTFGQITTQANTNRVMQFALRYQF